LKHTTQNITEHTQEYYVFDISIIQLLPFISVVHAIYRVMLISS